MRSGWILHQLLGEVDYLLVLSLPYVQIRICHTFSSGCSLDYSYGHVMLLSPQIWIHPEQKALKGWGKRAPLDFSFSPPS